MTTQSVDKVTNYKVKDMSLAEWGRKEIRLAEAEMPGLMSLRSEYADEFRPHAFSIVSSMILATRPLPSANGCIDTNL